MRLGRGRCGKPRAFRNCCRHSCGYAAPRQSLRTMEPAVRKAIGFPQRQRLSREELIRVSSCYLFVLRQAGKLCGEETSFTTETQRSRGAQRENHAACASFSCKRRNLLFHDFSLAFVLLSFCLTTRPPNSLNASLPNQRAVACDEVAKRSASSTQATLSSRFRLPQVRRAQLTPFLTKLRSSVAAAS